jgi:hypothetical protein
MYNNYEKLSHLYIYLYRKNPLLDSNGMLLRFSSIFIIKTNTISWIVDKKICCSSF